MLAESAFVQALASGDMFDPLIGQILASLFAAACRYGDGTETLRFLAFECIGILGSLDPAKTSKKILPEHNSPSENLGLTTSWLVRCHPNIQTSDTAT
jgi:hypothetical protein